MDESWVRILLRGRWLTSVLAMLAAVTVSWPLGELVSRQPWISPLVWTLVLVVVVGSLVRMAAVPRWVALVAQVVALCSALSWWVRAQDVTAPAAPGAGPLDAPGPETATSVLTAVVTLVEEGVATIQHYAVPAPATPGLTFIVLTGLALLALVVEALGVTLRSAALAGVPLLLVSATAASSTGHAMDPRYFLVAAACWLVLLAGQSRTVLEEWRGSGSPVTTTVDRAVAARGGRRRFGFVARTMGLLALALAVVVPSMLPHLPPTAILDGVGRGGNDATGTVRFTDTLDLAQDLADRSNAPVIRYRTDDSSPPPLRVTATVDYADGQWLPAEPWPHAGEITTDELMTINSMHLDAAGVETRTMEMTVTQNGMRAPQLALPFPPSSLDLGEINWRWDPTLDVASVDEMPGAYDVSYQEIASLTTLPEDVGAPAERLLDLYPVDEEVSTGDGGTFRTSDEAGLLEIVHPDGTREQTYSDFTGEVISPDGTTRRTLSAAVGGDLLGVDPASRDVVAPLADEITGDLTNGIDIALAIQRYLRGPDFDYSLTLADPIEGPDGELLDPISHFLATKQGYCTQYATAMVMMARSQGIPARMAIGFLPGSSGLDGTRTVVAADAHAWPELYLAGLGWTRFEPTPSARSGLAPTYLTPTQVEQAEVPEPDPTVEEATPDAAVPQVPTGSGAGPDAGWWERNADVVGWTALGLAGLLLVVSVLPLVGWWRREGWRSRRGLSAADRIEREWSVLTASLADLGVHAPVTATPRGLLAHYLRELEPDPPTHDALVRAATRLEDARYTPGPVRVGAMREDVRRVVEWWRRHVPRRRRALAALLPASAHAGLRRRRVPPASARATIRS